jgi:hypothetical protein
LREGLLDRRDLGARGEQVPAGVVAADAGPAEREDQRRERCREEEAAGSQELA